MISYEVKRPGDKILDAIERAVEHPWQPIAALGVFAAILIVVGLLWGRVW